MMCRIRGNDSVPDGQRFERLCSKAPESSVEPLSNVGLRVPALEIAKRLVLVVGMTSSELAMGEGPRLPPVSAPISEMGPRGSHEYRSIVEFSFSSSQACSLHEELRGYLGAVDADLLVRDLGGRLDKNQAAPNPVCLALCSDLNEKERGAQGVVLASAGYEFADDCEATLVCARILGKAREVAIDVSKPSHLWRNLEGNRLGELSDGEREVLSRLRDGFLRTRSGSLRVGGDGCLRFHQPCNFDSPIRWALGTPKKS